MGFPLKLSEKQTLNWQENKTWQKNKTDISGNELDEVIHEFTHYLP